MVDSGQLMGALEGRDVPVEDVDLERVLAEIRRQLTRLEIVQDRQDQHQLTMNVSLARLEQVFTDRAVSCPWRVQIDESLRTSRECAGGVLNLAGSVSDLKVKVATIAAGGGLAGGLAVEIVRLIIGAFAPKVVEAVGFVGGLHVFWG